MLKNEVYNCDNLVLMKTTPDKYYDLGIIDPPYGINAPKMAMGTSKTRSKTGNGISTAQRLKGKLNTGSGKIKNRILNKFSIDWDNETPSNEFWKEFFRITKNQIIFGANYFSLPPTRGIICWDKMQPWDNFSQIELIWTSFDKPAKLYRVSSRGGKNEEEKIHPTQKPIEIYDKIYADYVTEGMKVIDTHLGSGSHRITAFKANIEFTGIELNKEYFDAQEKRFNAFKLSYQSGLIEFLN